MAAVEVKISKISFYPPSKGYAILLEELNGSRQLPVIVGAFEAQAIALAVEGIDMPRPMTHDLISNLLHSFDVDMKEVVICDLKEGTYFARIKFDSISQGKLEIDSRPSDAIALALREHAPIYVETHVLDEAAVPLKDQFDEVKSILEIADIEKELTLEEQLQRAIEIEDYELAADLRDKIKSVRKI